MLGRLLLLSARLGSLREGVGFLSENNMFRLLEMNRSQTHQAGTVRIANAAETLSH